MSHSRRSLLQAAAAAGLAASAFPAQAEDEKKPDQKDGKKSPVVVMDTNHGAIHIELNAEKAPITVENFLAYVKKSHYDGTIFHRVIDGFMIQGGGFTSDMKEKETGKGIKNEASNGLKNARGAIAMARTSDPDSATAQFFINVKDNPNLDHPSFDGFGYAVFGKVTKGIEVVDKIRKVETDTRGPYENVPVKDVVIKSVKLL